MALPVRGITAGAGVGIAAIVAAGCGGNDRTPPVRPRGDGRNRTDKAAPDTDTATTRTVQTSAAKPTASGDAPPEVPGAMPTAGPDTAPSSESIPAAVEGSDNPLSQERRHELAKQRLRAADEGSVADGFADARDGYVSLASGENNRQAYDEGVGDVLMQAADFGPVGNGDRTVSSDEVLALLGTYSNERQLNLDYRSTLPGRSVHAIAARIVDEVDRFAHAPTSGDGKLQIADELTTDSQHLLPLLRRADAIGNNDRVATFGELRRVLQRFDDGDPSIAGSARDGRLSGSEFAAYARLTERHAEALRKPFEQT